MTRSEGAVLVASCILRASNFGNAFDQGAPFAYAHSEVYYTLGSVPDSQCFAQGNTRLNDIVIRTSLS